MLRVLHEFNAKYTSETKKNRQNRFSIFIQSDIMVVRWRHRARNVLSKHSQYRRKAAAIKEAQLMKDYMVKDIRNIAVLGHGSEGKTTLVESMLYAAGVIDRQGRVEDGNTVSDWDPEEVKRHISISASVAPIVWSSFRRNLNTTRLGASGSILPYSS